MDSPPLLYLDSFVNFEKNLSGLPGNLQLKRVEYLLELLGRPQDQLKFIHIAGSKGKGSTCAFTAHILKSAGYRVGLYTSPHFYRLNERIRILQKLSRPQHQGQELFSDAITDAQLTALIQRFKPSLEKARKTQWGALTYFEVLTVLAIYFFAEQKVDFVVLETGLGGRLDATNVVDSAVCAITPISLEHTQILGKTIGAIATEKAAIIKKRNQPVIVAVQPKAAATVIRQQIRAIGARGCWVGKDVTWKIQEIKSRGQNFLVKGLRAQYNLKTHLLGEHQAVNAATAVGIVESLPQVRITKKSIIDGIAETFWPGRLEIISRRPTVVLDSAHNPASCAQLVKNLRQIFPGRKFVFILGVSSDKDKQGILRAIQPVSKMIIATKSSHPRAYDFTEKELQKVLPGHWAKTKNVREALKQAADILIVTGSIFVVAEARKILLKTK